MNVLVTGSSGLVGSEAVEYFDRQGHRVWGIDNNMRREFFGPDGDTTWNRERLLEIARSFTPVDADVRDSLRVFDLFREHPFDLVVHCAAQPSHDKAREIPVIDFEVNALGTLNLLEALRETNTDGVFALLSTNKVYGDAPNEIPLKEMATRWEYSRPKDYDGVDESCRIDQSLHSLFGASKVAADVMAQEYGRSFGMNVGIFRAGCITGPRHSGVKLHGFLSHLVKVAVSEQDYTILGYKGKQVRDQIHSFDIVRAVDEFARAPKRGAVYNIGGGRSNSASVLESIGLVEQAVGRKVNWAYDDNNRLGDHICYITDLGKLRRDYPSWTVTRSLSDIVHEIAEEELSQAGAPR